MFSFRFPRIRFFALLSICVHVSCNKHMNTFPLNHECRVEYAYVCAGWFYALLTFFWIEIFGIDFFPSINISVCYTTINILVPFNHSNISKQYRHTSIIIVQIHPWKLYKCIKRKLWLKSIYKCLWRSNKTRTPRRKWRPRGRREQESEKEKLKCVSVWFCGENIMQ